MRRGDSSNEDFGRLFVRYEPRIYGFIRSLVINPADSEDLLSRDSFHLVAEV